MKEGFYKKHFEEKMYMALSEEKNYLEHEKTRLCRKLQSSPRGTLRVEMCRGKYPHYYLHDEEIPDAPQRGIYLTQDQRPFAQKIAQKEYEEDILKMINRRLILIKKLILNYRERLSEKYNKLPEARKQLVDPIFMSGEDYRKIWEKSMLSETNPYPISKGFLTEKGEQVRSKTEKILADKLFLRGIPYLYEPMLKLDERHTIYPDFAILNLRTRETLFYEHFGMMDDAEYSEKAITKILLYEKSGYLPGEKLIYSFETKNIPIDVKYFDRIIEKYCL